MTARTKTTQEKAGRFGITVDLRDMLALLEMLEHPDRAIGVSFAAQRGFDHPVTVLQRLCANEEERKDLDRARRDRAVDLLLWTLGKTKLLLPDEYRLVEAMLHEGRKKMEKR